MAFESRQPPATAGMMLTSSFSADGRVEVVEVADVLVVDVDVDEPAELGAVEDPFAKRGVLPADVAEDLADGRTRRPRRCRGRRRGGGAGWGCGLSAWMSFLDRASIPLLIGTSGRAHFGSANVSAGTLSRILNSLMCSTRRSHAMSVLHSIFVATWIPSNSR